CSADEVAEMAEEDRPERPHHEAGPEDAQTCQQGHVGIARREEMLTEKYGEYAVNIEIVPLDQRADRRCADDEGEALGCGPSASTGRGGRYCHGHSSPCEVCIRLADLLFARPAPLCSQLTVANALRQSVPEPRLTN